MSERRPFSVLKSIEESHARAIAVIVAVAAVALASMLVVVLLTERLRQGLTLGLLPAAAIFAVVIAVCWRAGARVLAARMAIAFCAILVFPILEIALYVPHARRIESVRAAAIDADDRAAMQVYMATPRRPQAGVAKLAPVTDRNFTINQDGFRGAALDAARSAPAIVMVGGSAVFGTGVADSHTLPAALEQLLLRTGDTHSAVAVVNLGVEAITIRQEVEIAAEWVPRIRPSTVIFYDGANDFLLNGWLADRAGRRDLYQEDTVLTRLAERVRQSLVITSLRRGVGATALQPSSSAAIVQAAQSAYAEGRRHAEDLCRSAKVTCVFVLQPIITDRSAPSYPEQIEIDSRAIDFPGYGALYRQFVESVRTAFPNTIDVRAAIADDPRMMFLDWVHLTRAGNELVAGVIALGLRGPDAGRITY